MGSFPSLVARAPSLHFLTAGWAVRELLVPAGCLRIRVCVPGLYGTQTLLKMGRYCSTTMCYYWDMSVKVSILLSKLTIVPILTHCCATVTTHF